MNLNNLLQISNSTSRFINRNRFGLYFHSWMIDSRYYLFVLTVMEEPSSRTPLNKVVHSFIVQEGTDFKALFNELQEVLMSGEHRMIMTKAVSDWQPLATKTKPEVVFHNTMRQIIGATVPKGWMK